MRSIFKTSAFALAIAASCGAGVSSYACDITSPTDLSCGATSVNPANPLSPLNPINQHAANPYTNPYSPYFSTPVYAYGILGLFEGAHPTIIYPAGPPRLCRAGIDCPRGVDGSLGAW